MAGEDGLGAFGVRREMVLLTRTEERDLRKASFLTASCTKALTADCDLASVYIDWVSDTRLAISLAWDERNSEGTDDQRGGGEASR